MGEKTKKKKTGQGSTGRARPRAEHRGGLRRLWRVMWHVAVGLWLLSCVAVLAYRWVFPPLTPLMVQRFVEQALHKERSVRFERDYVRLEAVSPQLVTAVVSAEDGRFLHHRGFDIGQLKQSYVDNRSGRLRGGSTISMQTAKNVFLSHRRAYLRKAFEAYFTQLIEWLWGKQRIMEVYLNVIEFGDGIYGCEAAAQHYFHHSAAKLTSHEAAQLAACLPAPLRRNPELATPYYVKQTSVVEKRMKQQGTVHVDRWREVRELDRKRGYHEETLLDFVRWLRMQRRMEREQIQGEQKE